MWRSILATLILASAATLFALGAVEMAFRLFPALLPAGVYGGGQFDPDFQMNVHGRTVLYKKLGVIERVPNRDGFLDVDHDRIAEPGAIRVGIFGDSYVEAAQVPLEDVFFRRLMERVPSIEAFGVGMSGWGTLHAMTAWSVVQERYDLDAAVYVFVENDLGDQDAEIVLTRGASAPMPVAEPSDEPPGYRVRLLNQPGHQPWWRRGAKLLQLHSNVARVVYDRIALLRSRGIVVKLAADDVQMTGVAGSIPNANDLAVTWPAAHRARATRLGEAVLSDWKRRADAHDVSLAVLYVPRGVDQIEGRLDANQTWAPWLRDVCERLSIPLLDPTDALRARSAAGEAVYADHWTPAGHAVIADVLAQYFEGRRLAPGDGTARHAGGPASAGASAVP